MWSIPWHKIPWISSRNLRVLLAILSGTSVIMLAAGFFLNRRRRRYQAVAMEKSVHTPSVRGRELLCGVAGTLGGSTRGQGHALTNIVYLCYDIVDQ